jgi:hypothetical protein
LKESNTPFKGFNKELFKFLKDLKKNNNTDWFHKSKNRYQDFLVSPSKSFITEMAPFLNRLNPAIRTEPKFNETIMRLNKDMRFAKGDPYRAFLLLHFGRFKLDSEFYLYFQQDSFSLGMFLNKKSGDSLFFAQNLKKYSKEIIEVCEHYKISGNYILSDLENESEIIEKKFNAAKHLDKLNDIDFILLDRAKPVSEKILFSDAIVVEMIKMISQLYPLYCFAISPQPLKELQKFEDEFGEIV